MQFASSAAAPIVAEAKSRELDAATLVAQALGEEADNRSAAIAALSGAPTSQAVPVLSLVLNGGEQSDRELALDVLCTLFRLRGDRDGAISDALRIAAYHVGDDGFALRLQSALEKIEAQRG